MLAQSQAPPVFKAKEIRLFCQVREHLRGVAPQSDYFDIADKLRIGHIQRVGAGRHVSDMLGHFAGIPASQCIAYYDNLPNTSDRQKIVGENTEERALDFALSLFRKYGELPTRIAIRDNGKTKIFDI